MFYLIFKKLTNLKIWISGFGIFLIIFVAIFVHLQIEDLKFGSIARSGDPLFTSKILSTTEDYDIKGNFIETAKISNHQTIQSVEENKLNEENVLNFPIYAVPKEFVSSKIDWTIQDGVIPIMISDLLENNPKFVIDGKEIKVKVVGRLNMSTSTYIPFEAINLFEHTKFRTYITDTDEHYKALQGQMGEIKLKEIKNGILKPRENYPSKLVSETVYPEELVVIYNTLIFWKYIIWSICLALLILFGFKIYQLEQKNVYLMQRIGLSNTQIFIFLSISYFGVFLLCFILIVLLNILILNSIFLPSLFSYYNRSIGRHFLKIL